MSLYYPTTQPIIAPSIMVRRRRVLPSPGDVVARIGQRVAPDDVVARANLPSLQEPVNIAGPLQVKPAAGARYLSKPIGATVEAGEVIATRGRGLRGRLTVKSPVAGTLSAYDAGSGQAIVTTGGAAFEIHALMHGVVTEHLAYQGVIIDTPAALVQGIFGLGGPQHGVLQVAVADPAQELTPDQITARLAYSIVLGGGTTTAATLQRAVEHNVRALIIGSIPEAELREFLGYPDGLKGWTLGRLGWDFPPPRLGQEVEAPLTLVVIEGFGRAPMTAKAWELLAAFDGQEVTVDGTTRTRNGLARPEVLISLPRTAGVAPYETTAPPVGLHALVRLIAPPYLGQTGRVITMSPGKQPIASGLSVNAAEVELTDGSTLWAPLANLEALE